ncbi:MAG: ankyrin repeat domain-containing protein [Clostridiales bacterium]|nr:ankyrin repeat domain-containing protein [Clostridiales bacterium]MCF8021822.1 ankyrin repeat domain-containing protein [Clostridiales bacterium]
MHADFPRTPEDAQKELEDMNISNDRETFFKTVDEGNNLAVEIFIDAGMDTEVKNVYDATPLILASYNGHLSMIKSLFKKGANVNTQSEDGITALMAAVHKGHLDIIKELIDNGADVNLQSKNGLKALMIAENDNFSEVIKLLKEAGAK